MVTDDYKLKVFYRKERLNPYCNGRWSLTLLYFVTICRLNRLNPYCNGRWSLTMVEPTAGKSFNCLNPYCNGRWSLTLVKFVDKDRYVEVLILIVMEDGH